MEQATTWKEAQQIIFFGEQVIDTILLAEEISASLRWYLIRFGKDYDGKLLSDYIPEHKIKLFTTVKNDMEWAKTFLDNLK